VTPSIVSRCYSKSGAARWGLSVERFRAALEASVSRAFPGTTPASHDIERHLSALHLDDLALATACADGIDAAWEHFIREQRPALYRAADAIDPSGNARDLADALYADLFGLRERDSARQSLFRYFHGRSSLATWLRAVLAQRHIDRVRAERKMAPLPDDQDGKSEPLTAANPPDPERPHFVAIMRTVLAAAIAALAPRDRLRLAYYYAHDLTLAAIGRLLREHEATVSRHLSRTRRAIRDDVEARLLQEGLDAAAIAECFRSVVGDAGPLTLDDLIAPEPPPPAAGKKPALDRSR
jgi:RNA polymerase sigma-70 factor, ECF subfamily